MPTGTKIEPEKKQRIIEMIKKHKVPVSTVSSKYGISTKTIYRWLKEDNVQEEGQKQEETKPQEAADILEKDNGDPAKDDQEDSAPHEEPEVSNDSSPVPQEAATTAPLKEECPNPSCGQPYDGELCNNCGYSTAAVIRPW